jgi:carbonic anhydrase
MESPPPATQDPAYANLERILSAIRRGLKHASAGGDRWANAVHASIGQNIEDALRLSPLLKEFVAEGRVLLVGALYDIESGKVDFSNPLGVH